MGTEYRREFDVTIEKENLIPQINAINPQI